MNHLYTLFYQAAERPSSNFGLFCCLLLFFSVFPKLHCFLLFNVSTKWYGSKKDSWTKIRAVRCVPVNFSVAGTENGGISVSYYGAACGHCYGWPNRRAGLCCRRAVITYGRPAVHCEGNIRGRDEPVKNGEKPWAPDRDGLPCSGTWSGK